VDNLLPDASALLLEERMRPQLDLEELSHFVDRPHDLVDVQLQEGQSVADILALLPVEQHLPHSDGLLVEVLKELIVLCTLQLGYDCTPLLLVFVLVKQLQESPCTR